MLIPPRILDKVALVGALVVVTATAKIIYHTADKVLDIYDMLHKK